LIGVMIIERKLLDDESARGTRRAESMFCGFCEFCDDRRVGHHQR